VTKARPSLPIITTVIKHLLARPSTYSTMLRAEENVIPKLETKVGPLTIPYNNNNDNNITYYYDNNNDNDNNDNNNDNN
jgi:hypothetical protein